MILGRNPVLEYLASARGRSGLVLYISEGSHGRIVEKITTEAKRQGVPVRSQNKSFFASLGPSSLHQGVALKCPSASSSQQSGDPISDAAASGGTIVVLDHLTDPHNVGSIIRTSEALGCSAVVMPKTNQAGITPVVVKTSAGATAHIPVITVPNISAFLDSAKKKGFWIIGTSDRGTCSLEDVSKIKPALIVIGSEGDGMKRLTSEKCDYIVSIPLKGKVSSLNASVAAGIVIHALTHV